MDIDASLSNSISSRNLSLPSQKTSNPPSKNPKQSNLMQYPTRSGQTFHFDISREACTPFGFFFGDR